MYHVPGWRRHAGLHRHVPRPDVQPAQSAGLNPARTLPISGAVLMQRRTREGEAMTGASGDVWEVMSTARTIRRFTDEPVDDITLARCLEAARWAPSGADAARGGVVVVWAAEGG